MTEINQKLYILAGNDSNHAFRDELAVYERRAAQKGDVVILRPKPGESLEDAVGHIKPPANIILAAHGSKDGTFTWHKDERIPYERLFADLPREGIPSVTLTGCYGEKAMEMLGALPAGTLLQSMVGSQVMNYATSGKQFAAELLARPSVDQLSILLEALDNTDPKQFQKWADANNRLLASNPQEAAKRGIVADTMKPHEVLPHTIGLGGKPPIEIDLDMEVGNLAGRGNAGGKTHADFQRAVALVKSHFDSDSGGGKGDEKAVQREIDLVAKKLLAGDDSIMQDLGQMRIGYAIAIANLHTSGEMEMLVTQARQSALAPAQSRPIETSWDGKGDRTVAMIQAIAEASGVAMDAGGARDGKVTGNFSERGKKIIGMMENQYNIDARDDATHEKLLTALLHDKDLLKGFATVKDANGQDMVNVTLRSTPVTALAKPQRQER